MTAPLRIANCSGFYGDRLSAAREMVEGGPIDVLTGDYLAELTMLILWKSRQKNPGGGFATTFLRQMEEVLGTCLDKGIKVVANAGGLNPGGLARAVRDLGERLGLSPNVAHIEGDDLMGKIEELSALGHRFQNIDTGESLADAGVKPVSANAYLGAWGIAEALGSGADVVICPRVTDASVVVGPAAWHHGWARDDWDCLAGAVVAGHVIECGPQATGGNYSFLSEITDRRPFGFPVAEVAKDGSSVITKHRDTGGIVSLGTVTAQLLYEIDGPAYANPDVVARFDTARLTEIRADCVLVSGVRGEPAPADLKVCVNYIGGYRNTMTFVLTGLDIDAKADMVESALFERLGGKESFDSVDVRRLAAGEDCHLRVTVKDPDPHKVGRAFSGAAIELALSSYAGLHSTTPPTEGSAYGVYWPTLVPADVVDHVVVFHDGAQAQVTPSCPGPSSSIDVAAVIMPPPPMGPTRPAPLGTIIGARSGDKGGNANVGLWARSALAYSWLLAELSVERFKQLIPEAAELTVRRHELPNILALNFVVHGLLGQGVASSVRPDPQAKSLGEYLRARPVDIPEILLPAGGP